MNRMAFGRRVIADKATPSPISNESKQVLWQQTRTLTLDDGSTAYGCVHCEYVSRNINSIRPHLGKHNRRRSNGQVTGDRTIKEIIQKLGTLDEITADRDRWKTRALKAEHSLQTLREALGVSP